MKQKNYKEYVANILPCIGYGLLTGVFTGITIFFFKFLAGRAENLSRNLYLAAKEMFFVIYMQTIWGHSGIDMFRDRIEI